MNTYRKTLDIKVVLSILVSLLIILLSALYIYNINSPKGSNSYMAKGGILELKNWGMEKNIDLDGEWEFYPQVLLNPMESNFEEYEDIRKYVTVPGSWESYLNEDGTVDGSGTYRLRIRLPKDDFYAIKTRTIRVSSRIFINGEEVVSTGNPSLDRLTVEAESKYKVGVSKSQDKELDLIIQVSSYDYRSGGIIKSIEFGTHDSIIRSDQIDRGIDALIVSVCLVLSIYFLLTYIQRGRDTYLGYFSGMNLFMGLYLSTMNEQLLDLIIDYDFITRTRIQILSMIMVTVCFLRFTYYFFEEYRNKRVMNFISILMLLNLLFVFNNPVSISAIPHGLVQSSIIVGMLVSYSHITYILFKAIFSKAESFGYIFVITSSMGSYWVVMVFKVLLELDLGGLPVILVFIMMITVALLMSNKLQLDYKKVNDLSNRLIVYDKLKDEFLAKASHELRTPLHVILNLTKSLIEGKKGTLNSNQQEDLFFINQEGKRLTRLVEDLLDASQLNNSETKLRIEAVEAYKIVEDILGEMKLLIPKNKDLVLINKIPITFPALKADTDKFIQIIYNLIFNSIKYTNTGEIIISAYLDKGQAIIQVKDTGVGIKNEDLLEIFDIFYQKGEENTAQGGLGLGLPIVKHLLEMQGGKIDVESVYGQGSSFRFSLPLYKGESEEIISKPVINNVQPVKSYKEKTKVEEGRFYNNDNSTVLIVDDEPSNQKVMANIVSDMGYNIILADKGKQAIEILEYSKVDLVVLDFMLPDMSGDQVCKKIREQYSIVELPILVLTASGRNIDLLNAFEYGANDFLKKPADFEELKSRLQTLLLMKTSVEEGLNREFQYFYSQISPHFLYNTLNAIIGLSYKDSEKARAALNNLSIYFRGKLDLHRGKTLIPLDEELELVTAYLEIEQMRYGERLEIKLDIEEGLTAMIPPLTLQPLVENAINHGIANRKDGGHLNISAKRCSDSVCITIEDDGVSMCIDKQQELLNGNNKRIGFSNVVEKLKILKGASLDLDCIEGEGTKIKIKIPGEKYHESNFG